jgi:hypothetical protein
MTVLIQQYEVQSRWVCQVMLDAKQLSRFKYVAAGPAPAVRKEVAIKQPAFDGHEYFESMSEEEYAALLEKIDNSDAVPLLPLRSIPSR